MRKYLFKLHGYLALTALIPIVIVSLTGCLLVFKFEIDSLLMPKTAVISEEGKSRLPLNVLVPLVNNLNPEFEIGSWELFDEGYEADRIYLIKRGQEYWYKIFFNPYTGEQLSQPQYINHYLTDWLVELHYTFLLNDLWEEHHQLGTVLGLIVALLLTVVGITGLIIYRKFWRTYFHFSLGKNRRTKYREIHRQFGLWLSPLYLILGATGLYFNLVSFLHEQEEHADGGHYIMQDRLYNDQIDFDLFLAASSNYIVDFRPTYLLFPFEPELDFTLFGEVPTANIFASNYSSTIGYSKQSGEFISAYDIRDQGVLPQLADSIRELHFGNFAGLSSKLPYALAGLSIFVSCLTGFFIWLMRKKYISSV